MRMSPLIDRFTCLTCGFEASGDTDSRDAQHLAFDGAHYGSWYRVSDEAFTGSLPDWEVQKGKKYEITSLDGSTVDYLIVNDCGAFVLDCDTTLIVTSVYADALDSDGEPTGTLIELHRDHIRDAVEIYN